MSSGLDGFYIGFVAPVILLALILLVKHRKRLALLSSSRWPLLSKALVLLPLASFLFAMAYVVSLEFTSNDILVGRFTILPAIILIVPWFLISLIYEFKKKFLSNQAERIVQEFARLNHWDKAIKSEITKLKSQRIANEANAGWGGADPIRTIGYRKEFFGRMHYLVVEEMLFTDMDEPLWTVYAATSLKKTIPGWARIVPETALHTKVFVPKDIDLESYQFNKKTYTFSAPAKLIFELFHPDTMEWYEQDTLQPWIQIESKNILVFLTKSARQENIKHLISFTQEIVRRVEKSGAGESD